MSWASHNPELYDEMCVKGVVNKLLEHRIRKLVDEEDVLEYVENLAAGNNPVEQVIWEVLRDWASDEIIDVEQNHFARQADRARDAAKDREWGL